MPILTLSGDEAMANVKANGQSTWPARGAPGSRLEPLARPAFAPSFRFAAGEKIFTIGSCFARNIEALLELSGFDIPTRSIIKADPDFASIGHNILNNYGTPSILNEIRWALDPAHGFTEEQAFHEIYPGKFVDAHLNHALKPTRIEVVRARRSAILNAYRALRECRVVIITLGLAECWFDRETATYINTAPRRSMVRARKHRFELHVLGYDEVFAAIDEALLLIRRHGQPDARVILTVSPVPLTSTFRSEDVMVANCYSKSVLRAAAEAATLKHDFVDYFPSFESVTLSERAVALEADQIHPTKPVIQLNTSRLIRDYVGADALDLGDIRETISDNPQSALALISERPELLADDPDLALAVFTIANKVGRLDLIETVLAHVGDRVPPEEQDLARARVALAAGDAAAALTLLRFPPEQRAARGQYWATRLNAQIALHDLAAAQISARAWSEVSPRTPEPFRLLGGAYARARLLDEAEIMFDAALALADNDAKTLLDYIDLLIQRGRRGEARALLASVHPLNPAQTERLGRLRLWAQDNGSAPLAPNPVRGNAHREEVGGA